MAVVVPNDQDNPSYIAMAVRDRTDGHADRQPALGTGVLSGVVVTGTGASVSGFSGAINVSAGSVAVAGTIYSVASVTASVAAPGAGDRRDVVVYRVGTGVTIIPGPVPSGLVGAWTVSSYPTLPPVKPTIGSVASVNVVTSTDVLLAEIYVPYNASVITSGYTNGGNIVDKSYVMTGLDVVASILQPSANVENIISSNAAVSGALQTTGGVMSGPITGLPAASVSSAAVPYGQVLSLVTSGNTFSIGKLMIGGHSYSSAPATANGSNGADGASNPHKGWPAILRDVAGIPDGSSQIAWPSSGNVNQSLVLELVDYPSILLSWTYTPITAEGTTLITRTYTLSAGATALAAYTTSTTSPFLPALTETIFAALNWSDLAAGNSPAQPSVLPGTETQYIPPGTILTCASTKSGSLSEPGGVMTIRLLNRYWNVAIGGSQLLASDSAGYPIQGGWSTWAKLQPSVNGSGSVGAFSPGTFAIPTLPSLQMAATASVSSGAASVAVDQVPVALTTFSVIRFSGGAQALLTTSASVATGGTTLHFTGGIVGAVAVGEVASISVSGLGSNNQLLLPNANTARNGLVVMTWGINDVAAGLSYAGSYKEALRHAVAIACCATYRQYGYTANATGWSPAGYDDTILPTNGSAGGTGAGAAWAQQAPQTPWTSRPSYLAWSGSTAPTGAFIDVTIPTWYDGAPLDLFFAAPVGGQLGGGNATITYAAAAPPAAQPTPTALFSGTNLSSYPNIRVNNGNTAGRSDVVDTGSVQGLTTNNGSTSMPLTNATLTLSATTGFNTNGGHFWVNFGTLAAPVWQGFTFTGVSGSNLTGVTSDDQSFTTTMTNGMTVDNAIVHGGPLGLTLSGSISGTVTSLPVAATPQLIIAGMPIITTLGNVTQTWICSGYTVAGSTSILVTSQTAATTFTTSSVVTVNTGNQGTGICKRITGLPAGGGKLRITINSMATQFAQFIFDLWGVEASVITQPVVVGETPYLSSLQSGAAFYTPYKIDQFNAQILAVINERTSAPTPTTNVIAAPINAYMNTTVGAPVTPSAISASGTTFTVTAAGTYVAGQTVTIAGTITGGTGIWTTLYGTYTVVTGGTGSFTFTGPSGLSGTPTVTGATVTSVSVDATYFWSDGLHPNDKGHEAIAASIISAAVSNFTNEQLATR